MNRLRCLILVAFALWTALAASTALAQDATATAPAQPALPAIAGSAGQTPAALSPAEAQRLLGLLNDDRQRADFTAKLEALSKAAQAPAGTAAPTSAEAPTTQAPTSQAPITQVHPAPSPPSSSDAGRPAAATGPSPAQVAPTQPGNPPPTAAADKPADKAETAIPLNPDSVGARVLVSVSAFLTQASTQAVAALGAVRSIPSLVRWVETMATDPLAQRNLVDTLWRVAVAMTAGIAADLIAGRVLGRATAAFHAAAPRSHEDRPVADPNIDPSEEEPEAHAPDLDDSRPGGSVARPSRHRPTAWTMLRRIPFVVARLLIDLLPIVAFVVVAHVVAASSLAGTARSRLVMLALIDAYATCRAIVTVARTILSPGQPSLRLVHVSEPAAAYVVRWLRRIVALITFGYALAEVGLLFGLSPLAHDAVLKTLGLILHVMLGIIVLQSRRPVAQWIRPRDPAQRGGFAQVRTRVAAIWHWIALFYIAALWFVWAVELRDGYARMMHVFFAAVAVSVIARVTLIVVLGSLDRVMRPRDGDTDHPPGLRSRIRTYYPVARSVAYGAITVLAALTLLQFWGLGALAWLAFSALGQQIVSASVTIGLTLIVVLAVWEAANAALDRQIDYLSRDGQSARVIRMRTLQPMLRTALFIALLIVAVMTVLSEIGVNIAPLLAGAGIVGVAIGFGSQKLVQDLITGIFLLLENAMQVGDWVTVSGLSGSVEHLSVRTIRLRAGDGSIHIIPFSAVTTVTNTNRGLGNAPVSITVPYDTDTDHVADVLREIVGGMQEDPDFTGKILAPFDFWGVDRVDGSSVTLVGQIKCTDTGRYSVGREFNRRMKRRFQQLGIPIYDPSRSYMIEVPGPGAHLSEEPHSPAEAGAMRKAAE